MWKWNRITTLKKSRNSIHTQKRSHHWFFSSMMLPPTTAMTANMNAYMDVSWNSILLSTFPFVFFDVFAVDNDPNWSLDNTKWLDTNGFTRLYWNNWASSSVDHIFWGIASHEWRINTLGYNGYLWWWWKIIFSVVTGLVSVARSGNAIISYQNNHLRIAMAANIRQISVSKAKCSKKKKQKNYKLFEVKYYQMFS